MQKYDIAEMLAQCLLLFKLEKRRIPQTFARVAGQGWGSGSERGAESRAGQHPLPSSGLLVFPTAKPLIIDT